MDHLSEPSKGRTQAARRQAAELLTKVTGRFYTPSIIGQALVRHLVHDALSNGSGERRIKVVDPFCGDGRLIEWLLDAAYDLDTYNGFFWDIHLWDCDERALRSAEAAVKLRLSRAPRGGAVSIFSGDSFLEAVNRRGEFDIVVTNPPWERLKPDARETSALSERSALAHIQWLKARGKALAALYPWSVPSKRFSGWGINLARCGLECALTLTKPHGWCAIVSPASFFGDQVSAQLRQWVLQRYAMRRISYYPAELKLFEGVDQPTVTMAAQACPPHAKTSVRVYDRSLDHKDFEIDASLANASTGYSLPVHGPLECLSLLERCSKLPRFGSLEDDPMARLWAGREFDETRDKHLLTKRGARPFIKGRMVGRFELLEKPQRFVAETPTTRLPPSVSHVRLVWRDVSRPTQKRRMQAAVIPAGWVTGNSLNVAYFSNERKPLLHVLLAVLNSLAFEIHIRALTATAHVSLGTVRLAPVPDIQERSFVRRMQPLVERRISGDKDVEPKLEALVARAYDYDESDFDLLLRGFPKLTQDYRRTLKSAFAKS